MPCLPAAAAAAPREAWGAAVLLLLMSGLTCLLSRSEEQGVVAASGTAGGANSAAGVGGMLTQVVLTPGTGWHRNNNNEAGCQQDQPGRWQAWSQSQACEYCSNQHCCLQAMASHLKIDEVLPQVQLQSNQCHSAHKTGHQTLDEPSARVLCFSLQYNMHQSDLGSGTATTTPDWAATLQLLLSGSHDNQVLVAPECCSTVPLQGPHYTYLLPCPRAVPTHNKKVGGKGAAGVVGMAWRA